MNKTNPPPWLPATLGFCIGVVLHSLLFNGVETVESQYRTAKQNGAIAERVGLVPHDNPYDSSARKVEWLNGWMESREKRMQESGLITPTESNE